MEGQQFSASHLGSFMFRLVADIHLSDIGSLDWENISKKHFRPGTMATSEWTCSVRAVRDTLVPNYSRPSINTTLRVAYRPPIAGSPFLLALFVSNFKQTVWLCGQL